MNNHDVIDIGLHVINHCGMYTEEYKNWILYENAVPPIVKTIESLREYWANMIALVNQTAVPALQHGYSMTAMDDDTWVTSYSDLLANFSAAFAATQETIKSQANRLVAMQNQLENIQLCMTVSQQPLSSGYATSRQQCTFTNHNKRNGGGQSNGRGFPQQPTMNYCGMGGGQQQVICPPTYYKCWENRNYCHSLGGDLDNNHTSAAYGKTGPMHNPNKCHTNIMGGSVAGMHKTILPLASGRTPPNPCPQQQLHSQQCPPIAYYPHGGTAWQQPTPPSQYGGMPPISGTYCQQTTMAMPVYQPSQRMMMNFGQYPQGAKNVLMMQMGQQPMAAPMIMNHYAPNQQPNQQQGDF